MTPELRILSAELFNAGVFKSGKFKTNGGLEVNLWFDLLAVFGHPTLMDKICEHAAKFVTGKNMNFHSVCGVSYAGLPFAVLLASKLHKSLLIWSKESSRHPANLRITGKISKNEYCLVLEEVTASGNSTLKTIKAIEDTGMRVKDVYCIIDLERGAVENLEKLGYKVHSLMKISQLVNILRDEKLMTAYDGDRIIKGYSTKLAVNGDHITNTNLGSRRLIEYEKRIDSCKSKIGRKLFQLMLDKKSNLCVEFVHQNIDTVLQVAELIGPFICIMSTHWNLLGKVEEFKLKELVKMSRNHNFLLMDDRYKTNYRRMEAYLSNNVVKGLNTYVDLLTMYAVSGEDTLLSLKNIAKEFPEKGIFIIASPNISDAVVGSNYEETSINMTIDHFEEVTGFFSSKNSNIPLDYIHITSDLKNSATVVKVNSNKSFYSPEIMVSDIGADVVKLYYDTAENIDKLVKKEQSSLWNTYTKRRSHSFG